MNERDLMRARDVERALKDENTRLRQRVAELEAQLSNTRWAASRGDWVEPGNNTEEDG